MILHLDHKKKTRSISGQLLTLLLENIRLPVLSNRMTATATTTKFTGAKRDIAIAATVIAAPLLIFSVGLLLMVRYNLVEVNKPYYTTIDPRFPLPELYDASSYFVYLSAGTMSF